MCQMGKCSDSLNNPISLSGQSNVSIDNSVKDIIPDVDSIIPETPELGDEKRPGAGLVKYAELKNEHMILKTRDHVLKNKVSIDKAMKAVGYSNSYVKNNLPAALKTKKKIKSAIERVLDKVGATILMSARVVKEAHFAEKDNGNADHSVRLSAARLNFDIREPRGREMQISVDKGIFVIPSQIGSREWNGMAKGYAKVPENSS